MENTYLMHHGIKGQKWGVRRYQNLDKTLTPEGRIRYANLSSDKQAKINNAYKKMYKANQKLGKSFDDFKKTEKAARRAKGISLEREKWYLNKQKHYEDLKTKRYKAENGMYAKIVGTNGRKIRRLDAKIEREERAVAKAKNWYEKAKNKSDLLRAKSFDLYDENDEYYDKAGVATENFLRYYREYELDI